MERRRTVVAAMVTIFHSSFVGEERSKDAKRGLGIVHACYVIREAAD